MEERVRGRGRGMMAAGLNPQARVARPGEITQKHLEDFFTIKGSAPIQKIATLTGGMGIVKQLPEVDEDMKRREKDQNYVDFYQQQEMERMKEQCRLDEQEEDQRASSSLCEFGRLTIELNGATPRNVTLSQLSEIEEPSIISGIAPMADVQDEDSKELYARYRSTFDQNYNPKLVITPMKSDILKIIGTNQVIVIQGSTGSGKTTQVPQFILDDSARRGILCNIAVTQPRRIAAVSIAKRVAQERSLQCGTLIGYQVGMDSETCPDTRITYMTTGVLLQKLIAQKNMNAFTHVIIDEIHERDQNTDFIMMVVRKFLRTNSRNTKVILMSATIDVSIYCEYFANPFRGKLLLAPVLDIPGKANYVAEYYLNSLGALGTLPEIDPNTPEIPEESYHLAYKLICTFDRIEVNEQGESSLTKGQAPVRGTVLLFLPGYEQITEMQNHLNANNESARKSWWILPLHSSITAEEQRRVFKPPEEGFRKIILSTNIAESSITVTDIKYVIDFCLTKNLLCDPITNYVSLQLEWAAKSNCNQRKGRTGRVSEGRVYRMVTETFYDRYIQDYGIPEMKRCPLELVVLRAKQLEMGEPKAILALTMDPPELVDIEKSILTLKEVGALLLTVNGHYTPYDGDMTYIGHTMAHLPIEVRLSKLILIGFVFDCLEETIIIAACLTVVNLFSKPFQRALESYKSRLAWADGSFSDCLACLSAYSIWANHRETLFFQRPGGQSEKEWAAKNFLQLNRLREVKDLIDEIKKRLHPLGIRCRQTFSGQLRPKTDNKVVLLVVLCGAFYPNYFLQEDIEEKEIYRMLSKRNPLNTVYVSGLPANQGILYEQSIVQLFEPCSKFVRADFEDSKALIQFGKPGAETKLSTILPSVYLAVKMRQLRTPLELYTYSSDIAQKKMVYLDNLKFEHCSKNKILRSNRITLVPSRFTLKRVPPPPLGLLTVKLFVTKILTCGHFFAQYNEASDYQKRATMEQAINMYKGRNLHPLSQNPEVGMLILAPFPDEMDGEMKYHRAYIQSVNRTRGKAEIFFVDFGNREIFDLNQLREIGDDLDSIMLETPALAVECVLSEIRPTVALNLKPGEWSVEANRLFRNLVDGKQLIAQIYSVVDNVLHVELNYNFSGGAPSVNKELMRQGFAEKAEEDYNSKQNNDLRLKCEKMNHAEVRALNNLQDDYVDDFVHLNAPEVFHNDGHPTTRLLLKGPTSPLEVNYIGMTQMASKRRVRIEQESVNSVTLDTEPQNPHQRMLVASFVCLNPEGNAVRARNTTLMPRIAGFPALMTLIFTPFAEFRANHSETKFTGALCGLGYNHKTKRAYYPEHDSEIVFDFDLDKMDIYHINAIRLCMNALLGNLEKCLVNEYAQGEIANYQQKAREAAQTLLKSAHKSLIPETFRKPFEWGVVNQDRIVDSFIDCEEMRKMHLIFPPHKSLYLPKKEIIELEAKIELVSNLHILAADVQGCDQINMVECELCKEFFNSGILLSRHLKSASHKKEERELIEQHSKLTQ